MYSCYYSCLFYRGLELLEDEVRRLSVPDTDDSAVNKIADIVANRLLPEIQRPPVKYEKLLHDLQRQLDELKVTANGSAAEELCTKTLAMLEAVKVSQQSFQVFVKTRIETLEEKLDTLLSKPEYRNTDRGGNRESKQCFYCLTEGHMANRCKMRSFCEGCGTQDHPYDRCDQRDEICSQCQVVGHDAKVHDTVDRSLRKKLYDKHPESFAHFFEVVSQGRHKDKDLRGRRNSDRDPSSRSRKDDRSKRVDIQLHSVRGKGVIKGRTYGRRSY